jgi:hypothetical protein
VVEVAQACLDAGTLKGDSALLIAGTCWAATHGLASLEANAIVGVDDATSTSTRPTSSATGCSS